jgi:hypothetical protein
VSSIYWARTRLVGGRVQFPYFLSTRHRWHSTADSGSSRRAASEITHSSLANNTIQHDLVMMGMLADEFAQLHLMSEL